MVIVKGGNRKMSKKKNDLFKGVSEEAIEILKEMIEELKKVSGEDQKRIARKLKSFVKSDIKEEVKDKNGDFQPSFQELEIVSIDYTGVGTELNNKHYGIVFKAYKKRGAVMVIPLTSKLKEQLPMKFNLGDLKVEGMPKNESIIDLSGMGEVSRKRIKKLKQQENPVTKKMEFPALARAKFYEKIMNGIAVTSIGLQTVEDYLNSYGGQLMPEKLTEFFEHRHKAISEARVDKQTKELIYYEWNKKHQTTLKLMEPLKPITRTEKYQLIKGLRSVNEHEKEKAEKIYKELYIYEVK